MCDRSNPQHCGGRFPRFLLTLAVASSTALVAGGWAWASGSNLGSGSLGAGGTTVSSCQPGQFQLEPVPVYDAAIAGYAVSAVEIGGLQGPPMGTCASHEFALTLSDGSATSVEEVRGSLPVGANDLSVALPQPVAVARLGAIHLVIEG
jgi:hypothetical protein